MKRMFARRRTQVQIGSGDQVLFGISLPSDTVVNNVRVRVKLGTEGTLREFQACMYGVQGYILPVLDPDAAATYEDIWDALVPKETDVQTMDLDTSALDVTPFFEPGEADWSRIMDVGLRPQRIYNRVRMLHLSDSAMFSYQDNQTPFEVRWLAGDSFQMEVNRRIRVKQPSCLVFAIASPSMDDTTAVVSKALSENQWARVKYVGDTLHQALMDLFGITEAGAETPWEEATDLLQAHLEPDLYEEVAASYLAVTYRVYTDAVIDHSVKGELGLGAISLG